MGKYISLAGSLASIIGLFAIEKGSFLHDLSLIVGILSLIVAVVLEVITYRSNKPIRFDRQGNIDYMNNIIKNEGEVVVFAGDLSWVDDTDIKNTMISKGNKLTLFAKENADNLDEYRNAGIKVFTYKNDDYVPTTRFTITRPNSPNEKIAIAEILDNHKKGKRLVYEISQKNNDKFLNNWIIHAAEDIYNLSKSIQQ